MKKEELEIEAGFAGQGGTGKPTLIDAMVMDLVIVALWSVVF